MDYKTLITSGEVVLVEFFATWCPHCRKMMPIVEQVKELLADRVPVYQLDIDRNQDIASEEGVESVPTFLIYKNGGQIWRHSGEIDGEALLGKVEASV